VLFCCYRRIRKKFCFVRSFFRFTSVTTCYEECKASENMVPQQSLPSMSGISLAVWKMTLSYYEHCILMYKNTSYTFTSFFDIECKIIVPWYKLFQTFTAHLQLLTALSTVKSVWNHVQIPIHLGDSLCALVSASILFLCFSFC
jgi:hypothetical protein